LNIVAALDHFHNTGGGVFFRLFPLLFQSTSITIDYKNIAFFFVVVVAAIPVYRIFVTASGKKQARDCFDRNKSIFKH